MFPAATGNLYRSVMAENPGGKFDFFEYGELEKAERLLEVVNSASVRDSIIEHFDLWGHYGYKKGEAYHQTWLLDEYRSNVKARRTNYGAVRIEVLDKDPQMAADIANAVTHYANAFENHLRKERALLALNVLDAERKNLEVQISEIEDSLRILRASGMYSYAEQVDRIFQRMAIEVATNNQIAIRNLQKQLDKLAENGGNYIFLRHYQDRLTIQLVFVRNRHESAKLEAQTDFPFHFVVEKAFAADKKSYPVRWLIVVFSTFAAVLAAIFALMFYQKLVEYGFLSLKPKKQNPAS